MYGSNNDLVTDHSILESAMGKHDKQIRDRKLCYVGLLLYTNQHNRMFTDEEVNDALAALTIFEKVERARINPYPSEFRQTYSYGKRRCVHCREADIQECVMARTLYGNTRSCDECTTIGIECSYKPNNDPSSVESKPNNQVYDLGEGSRLHETDCKCQRLNAITVLSIYRKSVLKTFRGTQSYLSATVTREIFYPVAQTIKNGKPLYWKLKSVITKFSELVST